MRASAFSLGLLVAADRFLAQRPALVFGDELLEELQIEAAGVTSRGRGGFLLSVDWSASIAAEKA